MFQPGWLGGRLSELPISRPPVLRSQAWLLGIQTPIVKLAARNPQALYSHHLGDSFPLGYEFPQG